MIRGDIASLDCCIDMSRRLGILAIAVIYHHFDSSCFSKQGLVFDRMTDSVMALRDKTGAFQISDLEEFHCT